MSLLVFLVACGAGAVAALLARPSVWIVRSAGVGGLLVALAAAVFIGPATSVTVGDVTLAGGDYSGLFLACVAGSALLLCVAAMAVGWSDEIAPAALSALAGLAVAVTATEPGVSLAAGAAAATTGALVIVHTTTRPVEEDGRLAEVRTIGLVVAGTLFAAVALARPNWTGPSDSPVFVLGFLGLGLALAVRSGAVPFHVPVSRFRHSAEPMAGALLVVWLPAGLGLLAISWSAATFGIRSDWLDAGVVSLQIVAIATLTLGALAALVQDDIHEVAAYSILADAGFVLLALAARTDAAAQPARLWILVFVAAKTGLVVWAAAVSRAFGTSNLRLLHGWLRRTPLLGLALMAIMVATLGWPGSAVYEARRSLISLALPGPLQLLFALSAVLSLAVYGRMLVLGVLSPTDEVRSARSEMPRGLAASSSPADAVADQGATADQGAPAEQGAPASPALAAAASQSESPSGDAPPETPAGSDFRVRLGVAWRLNRTLEVSLVVAAGAVLAVALAFGGLGADNAARSGIPLDTAARTTPTPSPRFTPTAGPTSTPLPSLAPRPTIGPSGLQSPNGSPLPSGSQVPINTSGPARGAGN